MVFTILALWSNSEAMLALMLLTAIGNVVWLFLVLVCHQRVLVQEETFETEQLRREREGGQGTEAIFDVADEGLLLARRRLEWMYRWLLPSFTIILIGLLLWASLFFYWKWGFGESLSAEGWPTVLNYKLLAWFLGGAAFLSFLGSRYATGMARQPEWRILHAGATYLMGVTLGAAALTAALGALNYFQTPVPERVVAYVLRVLLLLLAAETALNLVLDFYRPRAAGEEPRPAFDSRLLGLFTEPGGIARSIAEAINYQFGFEVSSTWFYKLLQRSVVPLIGFAAVALFVASSFVFVGAEEQAVVERFGKAERNPEGNVVVLGPGLHLKYPWPIDVAYKVATARIHELKVGANLEPEEEAKEELILWTTKHAQEPHLTVLVPAPQLAKYLRVGESTKAEDQSSPATRPAPADADQPEQSRATPVGQVRVSVSLQYRIRDPYNWLTRYKDPEAMLEMIAKREITHRCAGVEVIQLLGKERGRVEHDLREAIAASAKEQRLDIEIAFLGLLGVHPPPETAEAFQDVIGAVSKQAASMGVAKADAARKLSEVAGDMARARLLAQAITRMNELEGMPEVSEEELGRVRDEVHRLFYGDAAANVPPIGGRAASLITMARQKRWHWEKLASSKAVAFQAERDTHDAAPGAYRMGRYLETLAEATRGIRKYVMVAEGQVTTPTIHLNLQDSRDTPFKVETKEQND